MAAALRRAGRKTQARTFDAMIAATAIASDLPLFTCNPDDFRGISALDIRAVPPPAVTER
ncbi:MAG: PIN domain-containing protein [Acidimicrobiales bacterium]